jgi:hypothetical protein
MMFPDYSRISAAYARRRGTQGGREVEAHRGRDRRREAIKLALGRMKVHRAFPLLLILAGVSGCAGMKVEESTAQAVSIRYDGIIETLEDATEVARKDCARYGESVHLRTTKEVTTFERYAYFDCVSR